jgi:CubicO group peptidase (beta-lactamase class C family)
VRGQSAGYNVQFTSDSCLVNLSSVHNPHYAHLGLLLLVLVGCRSTPRSVPTQTHSPAAQIETGLLPVVQVRGEDARHALEARMRDYKIPAVSIAVFDNYELVWAQAYGLADVETGSRADEHTTFLAGSISKSVNALGQLTAVADGLLSLDAPINESLESWKLPDNELTRLKPVTLRMLLSHTGGTTVHGFRGYAPGESMPTIQQILDGQAPANSAAIRVDLAPGTQFRYSGGGITISQLALSERAKKPYAQALGERVLGPLGMTSSSYDQALTPERLQHAAVGYDEDADAVEGKRFAYPEMAAAGLWTTPTDLARFFIEIAKARAGKSTRVTKDIALEMTTKVMDIGDSPDAVGLGVFLLDKNGARYFGHSGADVGFQCDALASLDGGRAIVIMTNSENGLRIVPELERTVSSALGWAGADAPIIRIALEPPQRAKFVGRYTIDGAPYEIVDNGGKLIGRIPFGESNELVPTGSEVVVDTGDASELHLANTGLQIVAHGRPDRLASRATVEHPLFLLEAGRFEAAVAALKDVKDSKSEEDRINFLGIQLIARDAAKAAELLRLNVVAFSDSANAHDTYAYALGKSGKTGEAIAEYERELALVDADPRVPAADKPAFRKQAENALAKLRAK